MTRGDGVLPVAARSADLDVPYGLGADGRVLRYQERIGLAPSGSETSLELTYRIKWSKSLELGAYGAMRVMRPATTPNWG